jgi:uncharacterized protein YycO
MLSTIQVTWNKILSWAIENGSKTVSKLHSPWSKKLICSHDYLTIIKEMRAGDILVSRTKGELGNLFIPEFFKHVAMVISSEFVIEAVSSGVIKTHIFDFIRSKDYICLYRPISTIPQETIGNAVSMALSFLGLGYDYTFSTENKRFYCSELVAQSYAMNGVEMVSSQNVNGCAIILPTAFAKSKFCELVYRSKSYAEKFNMEK